MSDLTDLTRLLASTPLTQQPGMATHLRTDEADTLAHAVLASPWLARVKREALDPIQRFHDTWGDTEDAEDLDQLALWEDLGRLLHGNARGGVL